MTTDIKELVKRLRDGCVQHSVMGPVAMRDAADALEAMAGEVERLKKERDRLKVALSKKLSAKAREKLGDLSESMIAMGDGHSLEMLLNWYDESRKALGGDAS